LSKIQIDIRLSGSLLNRDPHRALALCVSSNLFAPLSAFSILPHPLDLVKLCFSLPRFAYKRNPNNSHPAESNYGKTQSAQRKDQNRIASQIESRADTASLQALNIYKL
jgi:hypothetical protein